MKTGIFAAAGLATALMLTGCGQNDVKGKTGTDITAKSSAKDIGEAYVNEMTRIADALETVKDKKSAEKAAKTLNKAAEGLNAMQEELDNEAGSTKAMQVLASRAGELAEVQGRMMKEIMRIQTEHPELMDVLGDELNKIN
ncbi:hypothetical protein [Hyphomonas pacifica]|uniref:Uncharacterized protein n=1 Tax=Hyphomonas pacifica TaxID=1280941 RepID=A0A062TQM1_9PROT|nr:hypothetical protein [Hyphomonas pacifica]KCZ49434.1 hypothetical protein HY2_03335 [Hyphomonas pacifica]RAN32969.1 hypothetical protein HY11_04565 [Hyphomonas pacifica]RAN33240.1 hypothetical protein HY3_02500 [Hyphomonas pacifica]